MSEPSADFATTAITQDGAFRVIALRTTRTVREAIGTQQAEGDNARNLADVITATILVRLTMAPTYRVQGIVRGPAKGTFVGDSHPDGSTRSLIQRPAGVERISLERGALMQMMRSLPTGSVNQGVVEVPDGSVSGALMSYFQSSEQITSMVRIGSRFGDDGAVVTAGGYLVQLLPEVSRAPLAVMAERLDHDFSDLTRVLDFVARDPAELLAEILYDMPYEETQHEELRFGCHCSSVRVLSSLATLPRSDIEELMRGGESVHVTCDYCGAQYELPPSALAGLLSQS